MITIKDKLGVKITICETPSDSEIVARYEDKLWYETKKGNKQINENVFAKLFREINNLQYHNGLFYTRQGKTTEELLSKFIWQTLAEEMNVNSDVERTTKKLLGAVKLASTVEKFDNNENIIPFANGDFYVKEWEFRADSYCSTPYRLKIPLYIEMQNAPNFAKWLTDIFTDEDIPVFQEYLGYCLVLSTKAQKALFLVGEGGAGKSVVGVILEALLGDAMLSTPNTQEFLQDKFKLPELENKLVLYDDDLDNEALSSTGLYKKLITNTQSITADRKYGQPFSFTPTVKLVSCCNEMLTSNYDNTDGFYRRLLPILIKPKSENFVPDLNFYDKIRSEAPAITQWALAGLKRLAATDWVLPQSQRTLEYLNARKNIGNHYPDFFATVFDCVPDSSVSTSDICAVYKYWCGKNAIEPRKNKNLQRYIIDNLDKLKIEADRNLKVGEKHVRGYKGLKIKDEWRIGGGTISI